MPSVSKRRSRAWLGLALGALLAGWTATAQAFFGFGLIPGIYVPQTYYKFGAVYTRAIVLNANGNKVWVEYGSDGKEAREIGEATGPLEQAQVMSGDIYRAYLQRLKDARERYPQSEVMTAATYRGTAFKTVDGKTIDKPSLSPSSLTVLVRGEKERFSTKGDELLLLQMPIDSNVTPSSSSKALLLSKEGQILHQGTNSIGFRAGFFGKDGKVDDKNTRDRDAKIYGPLPGVGVTLGSHVTGGYALTDDDGKYKMNYFLPPCPGFFFEYTTPAYLELYYKRFNPRGSSNMPYYLTRPDYDTCNGMGLWSLEAAMIVLTAATPMKQAMDFPIDLMVLDGSAQFGGGVKLGDKTAYSDKTGKRDHYLQEKYDFDGDEKPDWVVPGKKVTKTVDGKPKEVFVKTSLEEAELQGIYLSSRFDSVPANTEETAPDFTRLIDVAPDMENRGLLESISKDDLKDTDIYVFRESNGQLVAERRGLHEDELYKNYSGVDEKSGSFRYTIQLRGSKENYLAMSGRTGEAAFSKWQSAGGFKEEFQKRAANHLKAGETVRIIAINRPTGYIGSVKVELKSAVASGNLLNFAEQRIELAPPNLKVWAERKNKIEQGMTRGEVKKQLIGNEGAGLGSDISIAIYTDWRDSDNGPLPEELADYGFTGRLAKVVAANQLAPVGANNLSQFKIKPGQQVQVIQLPEKVLAKQHLYLQVAGQPENRNPDFSSKGDAQGILKYRPTRFVPVRVPLHDEEVSELARQAYRKAVRENPKLNLKTPEPIYEWSYRPELQFSLYELNMKEVRRIDAQDRLDQAYNDAKPVIASSDKFLEFYYDLLKSEIGTLDQWGQSGEREIVLAVGEHEVKVAIGKNQTIKFENLQHLGALDVDDFLSVRLYANNDQGNTLFEWAFEYLSVFADDDEDINDAGQYYYVSADSPVVDIKAVLAGYYMRRESLKKPETVRWGVEGGGSVAPTVDPSGETGIFSTTLTLPPVAGTKAKVYANLQGGDAKAYFKEILVVPGEVANISASLDGQLMAGGVGEIEATVLIKDRNGNLVVNGLGADLSIEGEGEIADNNGASLANAFKVRIRNAKYARDDNALVVKVGGVERRFKYSVGALGVRPPDSKKVFEDQVVDLKFSISNVAPSKIDPDLLSLQVSKGTILGGSVDAEGNVIYRWHTGYFSGPADIYFNSSGPQQAKLEYEVIPPADSIIANKKPLVLVSSSRGYLNVRRPAGGVVKVPVPEHDELRLKGKPNESVTIRVGDQTHQNRQGLLSLGPSDLGRSQFVVDGTKVAASPGFRYQQSDVDQKPLAFNYKGYGMRVLDVSRYDQLVETEGVDVDLLFEGQSDGLLFAWRDLLRFEIAQGNLIIRSKLLTGEMDERTYPLSLPVGENRLGLSIKGRDISYEIGSLQGKVTIDPAVVSESRDLRMLSGLGMGLRQFNILAKDAPGLIAANGQTAITTVLLDGRGEGVLNLRLVTPPLSGYQSVPVKINDELFTVASYSEEAATQLLSSTPSSQRFMAGDVQELLGRDVRDINPFRSQAYIALQVAESGVSESEKIHAVLRILETLPEGHNLSGRIEPLSSYVERSSEPFKLALRQELSSVLSNYSNSSADAYYKRILGLIVLSEVAQHNLDASSFISRSTTNVADLRIWLDWMAMPANGWATIRPVVPHIGQSCTAQVVYAFEDSMDKVPYNPCRLTGEQFGAWVEGLKAIDPIYEADPEYLLILLNGMYEGLADSTFVFRKGLFSLQEESALVYFDPTGLLVPKAHAAVQLAILPALAVIARVSARVAKKLGKNFQKNLMRFAVGKTNSRIPPMLFIASLGYALYSVECKDEGGLCKPLVFPDRREEAEKKIISSLIQFSKGLAFAFNKDAWRMVDDLKDNGAYRCSIMGFTHGHMYETFMISYYHALGRDKIVALDRIRKVPLYGNDTDKKQMITRRPDIEFAGVGAEGSSTNIWIELKSLNVTDKYNGNDPDLPSQERFLHKLPIFNVPGNGGKGDTVYHRQFLLDRIAKDGKYRGKSLSLNGGFHWRIQQWRHDRKKLKGFIKDRYVNNGFPTKTKIPNSTDSYFEKVKERLSSAPGFSAAQKANGDQRDFPIHGPYVGDAFVDPLFDGLGDIIDDEKLADELLKALKYSEADIADIKRAMSNAKLATEMLEKVGTKLPDIEAALDLDVTDIIPDELIRRGQDYVDEKLAGYVGCEDD